MLQVLLFVSKLSALNVVWVTVSERNVVDVVVAHVLISPHLFSTPHKSNMTKNALSAAHPYLASGLVDWERPWVLARELNHLYYSIILSKRRSCSRSSHPFSFLSDVLVSLTRSRLSGSFRLKGSLSLLLIHSLCLAWYDRTLARSDVAFSERAPVFAVLAARSWQISFCLAVVSFGSRELFRSAETPLFSELFRSWV